MIMHFTYTSILKKYKNVIIKLKNKCSNNPLVTGIAKKYPRPFHFLSNRFSLKKFSGLPLTLLMISFTANLLLLNELTESVENSKWMISLDTTVARFFFKMRIKSIADFFLYYSRLGSLPYIAGVALVAFIIFVGKRKFNGVISLASSVGGAGLTIILGKNYFHRIRPVDYSYYHETSYPFPSGHATVALAFYGMLFYTIIRNSKKSSLKMRWTGFSLIWILLLGFSRIYLGVHNLSDVLAGYSLGLLWLLCAISLKELKFFRQKIGRLSD
jgi:membrane-associated phospholipid phosphatase